VWVIVVCIHFTIFFNLLSLQCLASAYCKHPLPWSESELTTRNESSLERKFPGIFVLRSESSRELSFLGVKVSHWELSLPGTKIPGSKKSWYPFLNPLLLPRLAPLPFVCLLIGSTNDRSCHLRSFSRRLAHSLISHFTQILAVSHVWLAFQLGKYPLAISQLAFYPCHRWADLRYRVNRLIYLADLTH